MMDNPPPYTELKNDFTGYPSPSAPPTLGHSSFENPPVSTYGERPNLVVQNVIQAPPVATGPPQHLNVVVQGNAHVRGCPVCHNNSWTGTYPCLAWLLCFFCFPCGILCCCCMRKKKCTKCGFVVG